jgi:hypothetical protein
MDSRPELVMVRRALVPAVAAFLVASLLAGLIGGAGAAVSAGLGVAVVTVNFVVSGYLLAWASTVSINVVQGVALGGFFVRLGVIVGVMFGLNTLAWFSPIAFGLAVVPFTMLLLAYEAQLMLRGTGTELQIPADPAAIAAARELAAREAS